MFGEIIPPAIESAGLNAIGCAWLQGLILDGIVAGVGAVLGFVPQMLVLFHLPGIPGRLRIHGPCSVYHGQNFP